MLVTLLLVFCVIVLSGACLWIDVKMFGDTTLNLTLANRSFVLPFGIRVLSAFNEFPLKKKVNNVSMSRGGLIDVNAWFFFLLCGLLHVHM